LGSESKFGENKLKTNLNKSVAGKQAKTQDIVSEHVNKIGPVWKKLQHTVISVQISMLKRAMLVDFFATWNASDDIRIRNPEISLTSQTSLFSDACTNAETLELMKPLLAETLESILAQNCKFGIITSNLADIGIRLFLLGVFLQTKSSFSIDKRLD
jgi:hypothetical protein